MSRRRRRHDLAVSARAGVDSYSRPLDLVLPRSRAWDIAPSRPSGRFLIEGRRLDRTLAMRRPRSPVYLSRPGRRPWAPVLLRERITLPRAKPAMVHSAAGADRCAVRRSRREVLHALNIAGRRGLGKNGVRRTFNSQFGC